MPLAPRDATLDPTGSPSVPTAPSTTAPTSTSPSALRVDRLTAAIGAIVEGVDASAPPDPAQVAELQDLVAAHQVVFLRSQDLDRDGFERFAAAFGPLAIPPGARALGRTPTSSVIADSADRPPAGFDWHTDLSWTERPPALGFLSALDIPAVGGDTLWASGFALHDRLDPAMRQLCRSLSLVHRPDEALLATVRSHHGPELADRIAADHPPVAHPLVRRHPRTGRPALWLSPLYADHLSGVGADDGRRLLELLDAKLDDPTVQVRWRWAPGDLAIWDEASTTHRALTDHFPAHRRMRRTTTTGGRPRGIEPAATTALIG